MDADAIVLGAGTNGLAAAARLASAGQRVLVLERGEARGGLAHPFEFAPGFRAAPLALDPGWLPPAVGRLCHPRAPALVPAAAGLAVGDAAGRFLVLPPDPARAAATLRRWSPSDANTWPALVAHLHRLAAPLEAAYRRAAPLPPARCKDGLDAGLGLLALGWRLRRLGRRDLTAFLRLVPMSVAEFLDDRLETDALKAGIAAAAVQYSGHGPGASGTGFGLLHHLVGRPATGPRLHGWWHDGPDAPALALETGARRAGAQIHTGVEVQRILIRDYRVVGVALAGGRELRTRLVLSSADPAETLLRLVDPVWLDPEFLHAVRCIRFRSSAAFVLHALDGLPAFPGLDTQSLAAGVSLTPSLQALERAADAAKYGRLADRPHVEFAVPTLRWPHLAPAGKHVLVARVAWALPDLTPGLVETAVEQALDAVAPGWSERLLHRMALTPRDLERRYRLTGGAATQGDLALDQVWFMRPVPGWSQYATPVDGLLLCGAGTHPGPGVLGGPGVLAADAALRSLRHGSRAR